MKAGLKSGYDSTWTRPASAALIAEVSDQRADKESRCTPQDQQRNDHDVSLGLTMADDESARQTNKRTDPCAGSRGS